MHLPRAMRRLLFRRTRGPEEAEETAPSGALVGGIVLVTAAVAVVATCVGKQAARSADALGSALASDLVTPAPASPAPAIAEAPPARRVSPPPSAAPPAPGASASGDELDRPGQTTTTGETVRVLPNVQTAPPARRDRDAGAASASAAPNASSAPAATELATSVPPALAPDAASGSPAGQPDAATFAAPAPTGGAGPFLTEPPPWGASAYESNPEAGAGRFGGP